MRLRITLVPFPAGGATDAGPAKFAAAVQADSARWAALIRDRRITTE